MERGTVKAAQKISSAATTVFFARVKSIPCALALALLAAITTQAQNPNPIPLKENWAIQSSAKVPTDGAAISRAGFDANDWYPATVPTTVLAALVADKVYSDPYFGMNLRSMPGTKYKIGANFSNEEMPADSPFRVAWWYRTEFAESRGRRRQNPVAEFPGHQLSRQHLGERPEAGRNRRSGRGIPPIRIRRHQSPRRRKGQRNRRGGVCAEGRRIGNHLGGLESRPAG